MKALLFFSCIVLLSCTPEKPKNAATPVKSNTHIALDLQQAERLAALPLKCMEQEYPNKLNQVLTSEKELLSPKALHPAFYGCFDWHSAVHGHWLLVRLLNEFPKMDAEKIRSQLAKSLTPANIVGEMAYFDLKENASFERTYGWVWLFQLQSELDRSADPILQQLGKNLAPLTLRLVKEYETFLPKLTYPLRSGEHVNSAFSMVMAYDYAVQAKNKSFQKLLRERALDYYSQDEKASMRYEPSGFDFLSPNLEEIHLMSKVLEPAAFTKWLKTFLPELYDTQFALTPVDVSDRTDGKLVHLDGLNLSRAWCLYDIARKDPKLSHLRPIADAHLQKSLPSLVDGNYSGEHWLASFALYALLMREGE